jgi:hypothetical protein
MAVGWNAARWLTFFAKPPRWALEHLIGTPTAWLAICEGSLVDNVFLEDGRQPTLANEENWLFRPLGAPLMRTTGGRIAIRKASGRW